MKYIFVTGGVVSSLGKGLTAASLGTLLESRGLKVALQKFDPYLNVDPGTMSPYQHGEVYVLDDGTETDLDLGHYERFTHCQLTRLNNLTSGQVYQAVLNNEREGKYLGKTVQVIPHATHEIKNPIHLLADQTGADVKVMWNPEHLLSIGLESGYQYIYSFHYDDYKTEFGTTDLSASMYSIPIFIVFAMKVLPNTKITAGSGAYLLFNSDESFGIGTYSSQISIGAHAGISYTYPIDNSMAVGGELLYSYFSKLQDQTVAIQFIFVYDFLRW